MNRSTYILGFALLAVAVTLAATITLRNAPRGRGELASRPHAATPAGAPRQTDGIAPADPTPRGTLAPRRQAEPRPDATAFRIVFPADLLETMAPGQREALRARAAAVEGNARDRLERLTAELDLSAAQRAKMFPALVRSAPGYDPRMLVGGGGTVLPATAVTAAEEVHQALDPDQQAVVENQEVNRQLWWQDVLGRLEADLIRSTGGAPADPAAAPPQPPAPDPPAGERVAPGPRDDANLFDLLQGNP